MPKAQYIHEKWMYKPYKNLDIYDHNQNVFQITSISTNEVITEVENEANAKRICLTHNSHEGLVEACKESITLLRQYPAYVGINKEICEHLEQAIAQAEE